ncbi:nose resistant to fluoxetine protein 6 [Ixodes scapularis]
MHWSAVVSYCTINEKPHFTTQDIVIVCILSCLSLPVVLSTLLQTSIFIWDAFSKCPPKHGSAIQRLSSLSAYETARKLLVVRAPKDEDSRRLQVFHGLRALSIIWVVWVHHYAYNDISVYSGAKMAKKLVVQYNTQLFNNGWLAVDTFFFVSGFFLVYAVSKHAQTFGVPRIIIYTVVRWWRLIPLACIGICMLILIRFFGDGPLWNELISAEIDKCKKYWWLLMLNGQNFLRHDELCLVPYWYISVDTQLQILFIGFVVLLFRRTYLALFLMGLMVMAGVGVVMAQTLVNDYQPTALFVAGDLLFSKHLLSEVYFRPYTHFGPFCLGIVVAYAFVSKLTQHSIGKVFQAVCWAVSLCSGATILFCTKEWGSGDVPSPWVSAAYAGTHRLVWGLCLAWVVVACVSGRGGIVNAILSTRLLVPISRLSYSIYVLHVPLVWLRMWTIRERILISFMPMFYNGIGTFILSLVVAFFGTLFFERPLTAVKDVVFGFFASLGRDEKGKLSSVKETTFNTVFQTSSSSDPIFSGESVAKVSHFSTGTCSPPLNVKDNLTVRL